MGGGPGRYVWGDRRRAALYMTAMQAEAGFGCPTTMTFAALPELAAEPELHAEWAPLLTAASYDQSSISTHEKGSAIACVADAFCASRLAPDARARARVWDAADRHRFRCNRAASHTCRLKPL